MTPEASGSNAKTGLRGWLGRARFEVTPAQGAVEQVVELVPRTTPLAVASSPRRGLEPTLDAVERLGELGYRAVPHLAARLVRDPGHLAEIVRRLRDRALDDVFVVGGDSERPAGPYASALDLLRAMAEAGHGFPHIGIAGYPEPHPRIPGVVLRRALADKAPLATYLVSNLCFDPGLVARWLTSLREEGLELPVRLGVPGPVQIRRLARIARRIGVGESTRFLLRNRRVLAGLGGYDPGPYVRELWHLLGGGGAGVAGLHLYCFNDFEATERWLGLELGREARSGDPPTPRG